MTVNDLIYELTEWAGRGFADKPVYWINLNTHELEIVDEVGVAGDDEGIEIR